MKLFAAAIILTISHFGLADAQSGTQQIGSISRIAKFERFNNKPAIRIAVTGPHQVGGLYYCLRIGKLPGIPESGGSPLGHSFYFYLPATDWDNLKDGTPMWLTWGCLSEELLERMKPFAYLNKKLLTEDEVVQVPFTFEHSSVIVRVRVNGRGPYNMLLDTGAEQSAVDLTAAKELGLKLTPIGGGKIVGTGQKQNTLFLTTLPQIELDTLTAKDLVAVATDFSKISQRIGIPIHGVLGYNFLKNRVVQFDYRGRAVRFYSVAPSSTASQPSTTTRMTLPFRFYGGDKFPVIDAVYVNGKKIRAELDTGHSGVLALTASAIQRLGLEGEAEGCEPETSEGALGTSVNRKCKLKTLKVGTVTIDSPTVSFRAPNSGLDETPFDGLLGNDFFKAFVVTFDYHNMTVTFES